MDKQTIADELARLAGWEVAEEAMSNAAGESVGVAKRWVRYATLEERGTHPFPIGSLDALEAFGREHIDPVWRWGKIEFLGAVDAMLCYGDPTSLGSKYRVLHGKGPDEWTARASALIAAAKEKT